MKLTACGTLNHAFIETEDGEIVPNPVIAKTVDAIGDTAQNLGLPYASLAGEFWVGISGLVALVLAEKKRRRQKKKYFMR